jgi:hypothetical protein
MILSAIIIACLLAFDLAIGRFFALCVVKAMVRRPF